MSNSCRIKQNRIWLCAALFWLLVFGVGACGRTEEEETEESAYRIYYLNKAETALVSEQYQPKSGVGDAESLVPELLERLAEAPESQDWHAPLQMDFKLIRYYVESNQAVLSVDPSYREMSPTREVLVRAALVRTLVQIPGIEGVSMLVGEEPLQDRSGNPIGVMHKDTFVDNEGVEINAYDQVALHLYFADETGTQLVEINRNVSYNTNIPIERLVVEILIAGPEEKEIYPTVDPDTRILSVTDADGVCYVNLSPEFLNAVGDVTPEVTLYSIVNSLAELKDVHRVQFMVNGDSQVLYREMIQLDNSFSRNLDIVK